MRVLVAHCRYRNAVPSGENVAVDAEIDLLRNAGIEVHTVFRSAEELERAHPVRRLAAAADIFTGNAAHEAFADALASVRPDVVHLHNPYPILTPAVIRQAAAAGVPVVATVHNYRLECLNGSLFRDEQPCTACSGRALATPGIVHGCYRGSRTQSLVMAAAMLHHRSAWNLVSRFVAVSPHVAQWLIGTGVAPERVTVKPNVTPDCGTAPAAGTGFLYAGRLEVAKGIMMLLDAWEQSGLDGRVPLVIAGDGVAGESVRARAATMRSVSCVGTVTPADVVALRFRTGASVLPSLWPEAQSSAPESFAAGRPVIATRNGALGELVDDAVGWSVDTDIDSLAAALRAATVQHELEQRGRAARARYETDHQPESVLRQLVEVYGSVAARR